MCVTWAINGRVGAAMCVGILWMITLNFLTSVKHHFKATRPHAFTVWYPQDHTHLKQSEEGVESVVCEDNMIVHSLQGRKGTRSMTIN